MFKLILLIFLIILPIQVNAFTTECSKDNNWTVYFTYMLEHNKEINYVEVKQHKKLLNFYGGNLIGQPPDFIPVPDITAYFYKYKDSEAALLVFITDGCVTMTSSIQIKHLEMLGLMK